MKYPSYYWTVTLLILVILGWSNYLQNEMISFYPVGTVGWLIIFLFAFASGILTCTLFKFKFANFILGFSWLFIVILSILFLWIKPEILYLRQFDTFNLVQQVLKITLSAFFVFFGILFWDHYLLSNDAIKLKEKIDLIEKNIIDTKAEAELRKREAMINANEIIFDAKRKVDELERRKIETETKLREFLQLQIAILDKHEKYLKND